MPSTCNTQPKDFSAALASLQSTYGASGLAPVQPTASLKTSSQPKAKKSKKSTSNVTLSTLPKSNTHPQKDWEASFAALQSSFGFDGQAPTRPYASDSKIKLSKPQSKKTSFKLKFW